MSSLETEVPVTVVSGSAPDEPKKGLLGGIVGGKDRKCPNCGSEMISMERGGWICTKCPRKEDVRVEEHDA